MLALSLLIVMIAVGALWYVELTHTYAVADPASSAVIMSGCSSGIGLHTAHYLAQKGYVVFAGVRRTSDYHLFSNETNIVPVILDVKDTSSIKEARDIVVQHLGNKYQSKVKLIGVINNAAIGFLRAVEDTDVELLKEIMDVNLYGAITTTQTFLPLLKAGGHGDGSRIVNIGSIAGIIASPLYSSYSCSKFALKAVTDSLRVELYLDNISVSIVDPGTIVETNIRNSSFLHEKVSSSTFSDPETSHYKDMYKATKIRLQEAERKRFGDHPIVVAEAVFHALNSANPKPRYVVGRVGKIPAWVMYALSQILPTRVMDRMLLSVVQLKK